MRGILLASVVVLMICGCSRSYKAIDKAHLKESIASVKSQLPDEDSRKRFEKSLADIGARVIFVGVGSRSSGDFIKSSFEETLDGLTGPQVIELGEKIRADRKKRAEGKLD